MRLAKLGLIVALVLGLAVVESFAAGAATLQSHDPGVRLPAYPSESDFKLEAGGQVDVEAGTMSLAGQATHMGRLTGEGTFDTTALTFEGVLTDSSGDPTPLSMTLIEQLPGEYAASLRFRGWVSHRFLENAYGAGTLPMDSDGMFTIDVDETYLRCQDNITHSCY